MTSIAPHPAPPGHGETARDGGVRTLVARWSLRGVSVDQSGRVSVRDDLSARATLVVEVPRAGGAGGSGGAWWIEDASGRRTAAERAPGGAVVEDADAGLVHADAPGLLRATWRADGRPVFARTELLERLGVPGVRAEVVVGGERDRDG